MITRLVGVIVDGRASARTDDAKRRAQIARWIAGNVLAAGGKVSPRAVTTSLDTPCVLEWHVTSLRALLVAIATRPALVDTTTLPRAWRVALYVLGVPVLDRTPQAALAAGASIARVVRPSRMLAA